MQIKYYLKVGLLVFCQCLKSSFIRIFKNTFEKHFSNSLTNTSYKYTFKTILASRV